MKNVDSKVISKLLITEGELGDMIAVNTPEDYLLEVANAEDKVVVLVYTVASVVTATMGNVDEKHIR